MKASVIFPLSVILLIFIFASANADCWNVLTGSRCDAEDEWSQLGFKQCNDKCKERGYQRGRCEKNVDRCFGLSFDVNVCKCYR
ncbi:Hydramacin-1 [Aphelenchoides avenae]|nr:Hydramacin-1 [Aphelenchus avenae]